MNPLTGRTHQLRVQSAKRRLPIVGDSTYGDFSFNRDVQKASGNKRLFLHATSIRIVWEWQDLEHEFQAESALPEIFERLMELKFPGR
jgi:23S rRNA-/tRNA-specific pseudouridylate synthase